MPVISKRKLESYKRAERVAREVRYQAGSANRDDWNKVIELVINWMAVTTKIMYERPKQPKPRFKI